MLGRSRNSAIAVFATVLLMTGCTESDGLSLRNECALMWNVELEAISSIYAALSGEPVRFEDWIAMKVGHIGQASYAFYFFGVSPESAQVVRYATGDRGVLSLTLDQRIAQELWSATISPAAEQLEDYLDRGGLTHPACYFVRATSGEEVVDSFLVGWPINEDSRLPRFLALRRIVEFFERQTPQAAGVIDSSVLPSPEELLSEQQVRRMMSIDPFFELSSSQ